ncbi:secretory phospholipase A2 receptor-like isoform 5-T5 [Syngnathus typhle]
MGLAARLVRILALSAAWTLSTDPGSACEEDWIPFGSSCYKKMKTPNGWLGARDDCVWEGGELVSVASSAEEAYVKGIMGDVPFWIGLSNLVRRKRKQLILYWYAIDKRDWSLQNCDEAWCQYDKEQKKLTWSDVRMTVTYSDWAEGLNGNSDVESCAYVNLGVYHYNQQGKWRHGSCGSSLPYMCERSLDDCLEGRQCSFKVFGYDRVETSSCDPGDFLFDNSCYHFGREKMNWQSAEDFCKERKGHLASVHSQDVVKFLSGERQDKPTIPRSTRNAHQHLCNLRLFCFSQAHISYRLGWVGLARKNGNYEYTDGTSIEDTPQLQLLKSSCIAVFYGGFLNDYGCDNNNFPAICKKGLKVTTAPFALSRAHSLFIPLAAKVRKALTAHPSSIFRPGWSEKCGRWMENPANDFCYLISHNQDVTWQEARDKCVDHGGDLLSLADDTEQKFIQDLRDIPLTLWLGANAEITEGSKWTDGSPFIYKNLKADNASDATGGRCLSLLTADGDWKFDQCRKNSSYICKRRGRVDQKSCDMVYGWLPFGFSCYKKMATPNGWLGARHDCVGEGGDLVSVASSGEEAFVKKQMGNDEPFWIGLSNLVRRKRKLLILYRYAIDKRDWSVQKCEEAWCRYDKKQKKLTWSDVRVTGNYSNWDSRQVGSSDVDSCAYINQGVWTQPGKWRHGSCRSSLPFMCERPLDDCPEGRPCSLKDLGYLRVETSSCDPGEFLFDESCYRFEGVKKVQWAAERVCKRNKGHLASVLSADEGNFLAAHMRDAGKSQPFVGLKKKKNIVEWIDGKSTDYVTQLVGKKSTGLEECFALSASGQFDEWSCAKEQPSICKKAKVQGALPVLPSSTWGPGWSKKCGWWMDNPSNDFCYLINHNRAKTWQEARDNCVGLGGDLLSITHSDEQNFIQGLYARPLSSPTLWLGANANITNGIEWIDGSTSTYKNLKTGIAGEDPGGSCLSLLTADGRWAKADCKEKRSSYICKRRGRAIPKSACEKGWSLHQSSCYKKMETPNGWLGARYNCFWEGGDLVSIGSSDEEAFVKKEMGKNPFWIGLSNLKCDEARCRYDNEQKKLTWSDARETMTYSNWAPGQVGSSDVESCAYVNQGSWTENQPGKWRQASCGSSLAFMCERSLDDCPEGRQCSLEDFGYNRVETSSCDPGDFLFDDSCYHFEWKRKNWQAAEKFCKGRDGYLASVHSENENKFLAAHVRDDKGYWPFMGLKKNKDNNFFWSDATSANYITVKGEQSTGRGDCFALSASGQFYQWPCIKEQPSVCKKAKIRETRHDEPQAGWSEKCGSWVENLFKDICYLLNRNHAKTWQEARDDCVRLGGDLLSITDNTEQTYILGLSSAYKKISSWWLATNTTITEEGCKWTDGSPFRYTHWTTDSPSKPSDESCLSFHTKRELGNWKFDNCQKKRNYICKKRARGHKPEPPRHDGFREILVCNHQKNVELFCQSKGQSVIRIQSATYGRRSGSLCPTQNATKETCVVQGALRHYRQKCDNRQYCLADPYEGVRETCPAVSKYLHMVYSCERKVCLDSLVEADKRIGDSAFEASSFMSDTSPEKAQLNKNSCWRPSQDPSTSWIQVNLGHVRKVTGIVTQGCPHTDQRSWIIDFEMKMSLDGKSWNEHPDEKFTGGGEHRFGSAFSAQYVRILPLEDSVDFGLSFDLLGCARDDAMTCDSTFNSLHLTKAMTFHCPPKCANSKHNVTGTLVYNKDSSVCAAAIHAGVIRNDIGGDCIVMKALAKKGFAGSTQNGITSLKNADSTDEAFTFADGEPRCLGESWEEFAGFCYKTFEDKKEWAAAQTDCKKLGANLVSILSEVEQTWVKSASALDTSDMWTGLHDQTVLGIFEWSDRHEVTFADWAPEEPKHLKKDCVAMSQKAGKWKQMTCKIPNSFMCKMPKVHYAITSEKAEESHSGDSVLLHRSKLTKSANALGSMIKLKGGLHVNNVITITGRANKLADWFKINLFVPDDETDNVVALLLKLNFVTKKIWLYSRVNTTWNEREEHPTQSSGRGQEVKVVIKCADDHFQITINGLDEVTYKYREANLQSITQMIVWGHVSIKDIKQSSA